MEHTTFIEKISLWLDNELSPAESAELQAHLAICPACNQTYQAIQRVDSFLRQASVVVLEPVSGFPARFQTRLTAYHPKSRWHVWAGLGVLFVGTLIFLLIGLAIGGVTLLSAWATLVDMQVLYYWLGAFGEMILQIRTLIAAGSVILKIIFIAISQPVFWLTIPAAGGLAWLWLRLMRASYRHLPAAVEMII